MILRDYLHYEKITLKDFCKSIDYNVGTIGGYIHGRIRISRKIAKKIAEATNGKVSMGEILGNNPPLGNYKKNVNKV